MGKLDPHVAQSTKSDDTDLLALGDAPVMQGRESGDAGAEQRRGARRIEIRRNLQDEPLIDHNAVGVAAVGNTSRVSIGEVIGEGKVRAELFKPFFAFRAGAVGIDHAANGAQVADFKFLYSGADFGDPADNFVARDDRVDGGHCSAPLIARLMQVGVTDSAEEDFYLHVVLGWIAPLDGLEG